MNTLMHAHGNQRYILICNKKTLNIIKAYSKQTILDHIGVLDKLKTSSNYKFGQSFVNKMFSYRGIILHPWTARSYNWSKYESLQHKEKNGKIKKCTPELETYYQVLVDSRDTTKLLNYFSEPIVLFKRDKNLVSISGIDYVLHKNIIPYISCEKYPVQHNLFNKFCKICKTHPIYQPSEIYEKWQKRNHIFLEVNDVHKLTTNHIRVTVIPFFLGAHEITDAAQKPEFLWRFLICLENLGNFKAQVKETYLRMVSEGTITTRRCSGLMGSSSILKPSCPALQMSIKLLHFTTPSVHVDGKFSFAKEDGEQFDVKLPVIFLDSKARLKSCYTNQN